jgi:hypothetical protein
MCLFMVFDTYVIKVLEGHPKDGCQKLKHYTILCVQQQPSSNTCGFYVCMNMVTFRAHPKCSVSVSVSVSAFIFLYC